MYSVQINLIVLNSTIRLLILFLSYVFVQYAYCIVRMYSTYVQYTQSLKSTFREKILEMKIFGFHGPT